jgi:hypothetical protein
MNKDEVAAINFWLAPENARARRELELRQPELAAWLRKVENLADTKMSGGNGENSMLG